MFQEYNLLNEYTVEKNIAIAMELQGETLNQNQLDNLLSTVDITDLKHRKPSELSGGQRQRVAIARALVKNPKIIIADEPTGALDSNTGIQVFDILKKLSKEKLVIVVSHDTEFAEKYADRIIRLVDGNIVEDITFNENEISENIREQDNGLIIKNGADLTEKEKGLLADAIKNKKKIEIIEKLSCREKEPTKEVELKNPTQPVKFKKSQMKFKSAFSLGLKSLGVKPLRLIFTVFLSAVAFAVLECLTPLQTLTRQTL
ncbi:MAG: ATP-binding cassette domain-containing protein [Clostridia bacterium]|nr:ATP-binding cassette domain-containing protein [Clostridia bacterium]